MYMNQQNQTYNPALHMRTGLLLNIYAGAIEANILSCKLQSIVVIREFKITVYGER